MVQKQSHFSIIAIDGPAGSGKSTTAKLLARKLGFLYLDTGAMYRAVTLKAMRQHVDLTSDAQLKSLLDRTKIDLVTSNGRLRVFLDGQDVTREIRSLKVSENVSKVAAQKSVREYLVKLQRQFAQKGNVIAEGRDIGTVVFPNAQLKIFLVASIEERAKRRLKSDVGADDGSQLEKMKQAIEQRDQADSSRENSPLKKAADAIEIDTTNLTIEQQVEAIAQLWEKVSKRSGDRLDGNQD